MISSFILKIFGIDTPPKSGFVGMAFQFIQPWSILIAIMAFLILIVGVTWLYERTRKPLSRWTKTLLAGLRIAAGALILLLIFEPIANVKFFTDQRAHMLVLFDVSQSMGLKDPRAGYRMETMTKALADPKLKFLPALREKYEVDAWTFASDVRQLQLKKEAEAFPAFQVDRVEGQRTRLGDALVRAFGELKGEQVAGVVIVSDGQSNDGEDPVSIAHLFKQSKIPIFTVGVGDSTPPKDVRVLEPIAPEEVFLGDSILVQADVVQTGFQGRTATVRVIRDKTVEVGKAEIRLPEDRQKHRVAINVVADEPGVHDYLVKVDAMGEELSLDNNVKSFRLKISEEKLKVLYVEGKPRRVFRFLKNALFREPTIEFNALLQVSPPDLQPTKGMAHIRSFPKSPELLMGYDILVIGDIELKRSGFLSTTQLELIKRFVAEGHGLLVIAGDEHEGTPYSFKGTPLEELLPVTLEESDKRGISYEGRKGFKMAVTAEGADHAVMKVKDTIEATKKFWEDFEFTWAAKVGRPKEGAKVLAVHPDRQTVGQPLPLMVLGRYGVGKVAYIGINELWRLRKGSEDENFWTRFSRPLLHWLSPPKGAGKFIDLRTDRPKYQGGEKVRLTVALHKPGMLKLTKADVKATIRDQEGMKEEVALVEEGEGVYTGTYVPPRRGKFTVEISQAPEVGAPLEDTKISFFVEVPNLEFERPEMNEAALKEMASLTGGKYFPIKDIGKLLTVVLTTPAKVIQSQQKELHDTPLAVIALIAFFSMEWYLRRKRGLL